MRHYYFLCAVFLHLTLLSGQNDYYWIGGGGNWNDLNHWATTSGGMVLQGGLPNAGSNVFFDANSFVSTSDTVNIPTGYEVECRNLSWEGLAFPVTWAGDYSTSVNIFGDLKLHTALNLAFGLDVNFNMLSNQDTTELVLPDTFRTVNIFFSGSSYWRITGEIHLRDVSVEGGYLDCSGRNISMRYLFRRNDGQLDVRGTEINIVELEHPPSYLYTVGSLVYRGTREILIDEQTEIYLAPERNGIGIIDSPDTIVVGKIIGEHHTSIGAGENVFFSKVEMGPGGHIVPTGHIDSLILAAGGYYTFAHSSDGALPGVEIVHLIARGSCRFPIFIDSEEGLTPQVFSRNDQIMENVIVRRLRVKHDPDNPLAAGQWSAINSYDHGGNENVTVVSTPPTRTLYRLSGSSEWYDPDYWSLTSNGAGGECPPKPTDNVVFDQFSYADSNGLISSEFDYFAYPTLPLLCRDLSFVDPVPNYTLRFSEARVFGSLLLKEGLTYSIDDTQLWGGGSRTIETNTVRTGDIAIMNSGKFYLQDPLYSKDSTFLEIKKGSLFSQGHFISYGGMGLSTAFHSADTLDLSGSTVTLTGLPRAFFGPTFLFDTNIGASSPNGPRGNVNVENTTFYNHYDGGAFKFSNRSSGFSLITPDSTHRTEIIQNEFQAFNAPSFKLLDLAGDSYLLSNLIVDTLRLKPGTNHILRAPRRITVNHLFDAQGSSCRPIHLASSQTNFSLPKMVFSDSVLLKADYLKIDQVESLPTGLGYAGPNSRIVGIGNSSDPSLGWIIDYQPGVAPFSLSTGFLGRDTLFCDLSSAIPIAVDTDLAPSDLNYDYLWANGSNENVFLPIEPGAYSLSLTFKDQSGQFCTQVDTVNIRIRSFEPIDWFPPYETMDATCFDRLDGQLLVYPADSLGAYTIDNGLPPDLAGGFSGLANGNHNLIVIGPEGCPAAEAIFIGAPDSIATDLPLLLTRLHPETARHSLNVVGGTAPYTYSWLQISGVATSEVLSCSDCPSPIFTPTTPSRFSVGIIDANGCTYQAETLVVPDYMRGVYLPNAFSPDRNGINDRLVVFGPLNTFKVTDVRIYDRWGNEWYHTPAQEPNANQGWDGFAPDGRPAPSGTYLFVANISWADGVNRQLKQSIQLIR